MPPGPPGGHILIKNDQTDPKIRKIHLLPYFSVYFELPIDRLGGCYVNLLHPGPTKQLTDRSEGFPNGLLNPWA